MPERLLAAEIPLFFMCEKDHRTNVGKTKSRFARFNPALHENKITRGKCRLEKTNLPEYIKYPIILPGEHPIFHVFGSYHHNRLLQPRISSNPSKSDEQRHTNMRRKRTFEIYFCQVPTLQNEKKKIASITNRKFAFPTSLEKIHDKWRSL